MRSAFLWDDVIVGLICNLRAFILRQHFTSTILRQAQDDIAQGNIAQGDIAHYDIPQSDGLIVELTERDIKF